MNSLFQISNVLISTGLLNSTQLSIFTNPEELLPPACVSLFNPSNISEAFPSYTNFGGITGGAVLAGGGECAIAVTFVATQMYNAITTIGYITPTIY